MVLAISNQVALRYVAESTLGTTPSSPALSAIRFTGEDLNFNIGFEKSDEISSDRMVPDTIQTEAGVDGSINAELSYASFDDFFEAGLFTTWVTTGSTVAAATDISFNKTAGTPNTYALESVSTDFTAQSWVVGQWIKVTGFSPAGTFYAQIVSIAAHTMTIYPTADIVDDAAGDSVTIAPINYVRNGTTRKSFTIQKAFTDLGTPVYYNFLGMVVDSIMFTIETKSIMKMEFGFVGKSGSMTTTQFSSATTPAANTNGVMSSVGNVSAIVFDGDPGASTYYFNKLEVEINNNVRGQDAVGTLGYIGIVPGRMEVTGSIELYFDSNALFTKFQNATAFALSIMVADSAGQRYILTIPRAKYTSMEIVAGGLDEDIFVSAEFEGIKNTAGTYQVQISRHAS
jgi:hypothetical protein